MDRDDLTPVTDVNPTKFDTRKILEAYKKSGGFTAKKVGIAKEILKEIKRTNTHFFLSFPACIIATGTRGVIKELVKSGEVDSIVTTCGTLDHDLARVWKDYYHGSFELNDKELKKMDIFRLGNILIPQECYGPVLEDHLQPIFKEINEDHQKLSTNTLVKEIGKRIDNKESIVYWAAKNDVDIFVPGITDGAVGTQIWTYAQGKEFNVDVWKDEDELSDIVFEEEDTSSLMVGGGISKHHTIWWNQFKDGLDRAVFITTAPEWDGSLSGAKTSEAISWSKIKPKADHVTIEGEATALLPLLISSFLRE